MNRGVLRNQSGPMMGTGLLGNAPPGFQGNVMQNEMQMGLNQGIAGMSQGSASAHTPNMSLLGNVPMQQQGSVGGVMRGAGNMIGGISDMMTNNSGGRSTSMTMGASGAEMNQRMMAMDNMQNMPVNQAMLQNNMQGMGGGNVSNMQMNQRMGGPMQMSQLGNNGMPMNPQAMSEAMQGNALLPSAGKTGFQNTDTSASRSLLPTPGNASYAQGGNYSKQTDERRVEWDRKEHGGHIGRDFVRRQGSPVKNDLEEYNPEEPTDDDFVVKKGSDEHYRMNTGSPVIGHKRTMPLSQYDDLPQMKRREVLFDQKHMDSQHMMQNGNHGNSDKFHCHLCNFDGVNIEEFDLHMNSEVHMQRMASISSLYQARTEQQVQRMKAEQMLRRLERDDSDMCDICQKKVTTSFAEHRSNTEHVRKERMTKRGCILCKTGSFDNYPSYVVHIDSESHKQAKNKLNVDLEMKKKDSSETNPKSHDMRRRPSRESHDSSKSHDSSRSHESTRRTTRESHDSHRRHNESHDRQRRKSAESTQDSHNKRHESHSNSSRHRHQRNSSPERENREIHHHRSEGERRGSSENKAQNRDSKQEEVGNKETEMVDLAKVKQEPVEDQKPVEEEEEEVEMVQEELIYDPDVAVGSEFVIPVKGFFCKLCHKFYNSEELARNIHCKAEKHFEKYQEYVISQQQEASDLPSSKPAQAMIQGSIKTEKGSSNKFHSHKKNSMDQEMEQLSIKISNVQSVSQDVAFQDNIDSNHTMEVEASNPSNGMGDAPIKREPSSLSQQTSNRKLRLSRRGRNN